MAERKLPDANEPLSDWEKALLEKLLSSPDQLPQKFKNWVADYVATNGSFHVSSLPTLKGEEWREVGATGQPAFQNSWANWGAGHETAAFYKDAVGLVHIKGLIKSGSGVAFTLPSGYRPPVDLVFATGADSTGAWNIARWDVQADGDVQYMNGPAATAFTSINFPPFRAA